MSMIQSDLLLGQEGGAGYTIPRSLRFNSADSSFLSRTPASAGNRRTYTFSAWVKLCAINNQFIFSSTSGGARWGLYYGSDAKLRTDIQNTGAFNESLAVYRDPSAWYHIVWTVDTTNGTATDRSIIYVNGARIADANPRTLSLNSDTNINTTNIHYISRSPDLTWHLDAYLADIHFIDGQALTPTSFGQFDANNVWQPKAFSGTYGTNGFKLDFADNSNNTAATLGKDTSGNGNNWTPTNLSVTAGAGNDSLRDSPTNGSQTDTGVGGEVSGNYCTLNPLEKGSSVTLSNGNLNYSFGAASQRVHGTIGVSSGKWYWEETKVSGTYGAVGISRNVAPTTFTGNDAFSWSYNKNGNKYHNGTGASYGATWDSGDTIGIAFDADNGTIQFYKNGVSQGVAYSNIPVGNTYFPACGDYDVVGHVNFGQRSWAYAAPSGFKALCTANLPTPTIANGATAMDVLTWSGNGSNPRTFTGLKHSPDLVWIKERNTGAWSHCLFDQLRGNAVLHSNLTNAETATHPYGYVSAFTSDGFTVAAGSSGDEQVNDSAITYVGWTWDAGSSTVTNNSGSISSQVRANPSAGFSVVTYTGNGTANASVGHGLNIAPDFVIVKTRSKADGWNCYHRSLGNAKPILLNSASAAATNDTAVWGTNAGPTSSVFYVNYPGSPVYTNENNTTYVAYCFAPVAGYSAFGSYTGNGQTGTSGPFIFCGFRPKFVLIKKSNDNDNWKIFDSVRDTYNVTEKSLQPNVSNAELIEAYNKVDILSNGFAIRVTDATYGLNTNHSFIWAAWAEHPFQYARAR